MYSCMSKRHGFPARYITFAVSYDFFFFFFNLLSNNYTTYRIKKYDTLLTLLSTQYYNFCTEQTERKATYKGLSKTKEIQKVV